MFMGFAVELKLSSVEDQSNIISSDGHGCCRDWELMSVAVYGGDEGEGWGKVFTGN